MKNALILAALVEVGAGLALGFYPSLALRLLFGTEVTGAGLPLSRVTGFALLALGIACWPAGNNRNAVAGVVAYGVLVALFLTWLGTTGQWTGPLLWPTVVLHTCISGALFWLWLRRSGAR